MRIEKIRIQHFQCISDSGELPLDERLTVLVGANESGKSAILKALWQFNQENNFKQEDLSTLSGVREHLDRGIVSHNDVEIVTLWMTLAEKDLILLGLPAQAGMKQTLKAVKTLDNEYRFEIQKPKAVTRPTGYEKLRQLLRELEKKLNGIYKGRIKRKLPTDYFAWLERHEDEDRSENLILFPEWAPEIWDDLQTGQWIHVTRVEEDPYGRNARALNVGFAIELDPIVGSLANLIGVLESKGAFDEEAFDALQRKVNEIPQQHPLREYLNAETISEILRLSQAGTKMEEEPPDLTRRIRAILPEFVYLDSLPNISNSVSVRSLTQGTGQESDVLLTALMKVIGLQSQVVTQENVFYRKQVLADKANVLTQRVRENWFNKDLTFELEKDGQRLALWVSSGGSLDPPSRRSKGLASYISLFAKFADLSIQRNVITLLDDPCVYLHPMAQREILPLLDSQPFQIIMATHLPYMIDPDRIERVRAVVRTETGTHIEADWERAKETLLPIWGSLMGNYPAGVWLVVEGPRDKRVYSRMSEACKVKNRACLPDDLPIVPGGGNTIIHLVPELTSRGIVVVVLLDGDDEGRLIKNSLLKHPSVNLRAVITLAEVGLSGSDLEVEDLFSPRAEIQKAMSRDKGDQENQSMFSSKTLDTFQKIFQKVDQIIRS